jgi:predicted  nucleic acid-binding Zn-ribbon protein
MASADTDNSMMDKPTDNKSENIERIQTQIDMIRQESRILSYRIERMMEQRKGLSEEKRKLKEQLETLSV